MVSFYGWIAFCVGDSQTFCYIFKCSDVIFQIRLFFLLFSLFLQLRGQYYLAFENCFFQCQWRTTHANCVVLAGSGLMLSAFEQYAILLIQIFASFRPLLGQNSVARSHFVLLIHQICSFCPHRGLGRTNVCISKMVYFVRPANWLSQMPQLHEWPWVA